MQVAEDDDDDNEEEYVVAKTIKVHVPPITVLKCNFEQMHQLCKTNNIADYSVRKVSIGIKLYCKNKSDYDLMIQKLTNKFEFFSYATKSERPYKALLFGLDKMDPSIIKKQLISMGLKCLDVKPVEKSGNNNLAYVFYVVYFERQSITLKELKQSFSNIEHIRVRWEFQRQSSNKVTQCYNCQMFGHGASRCKVKTFCAICAGNHATANCEATIVKCTNCRGAHKSNSNDCPVKLEYIRIKQQHKKQPVRREAVNFDHRASNYNDAFPNAINQGIPRHNSNWGPQPSNNDLFTLEELKDLTIELITNLKNCKTKTDQFDVVTKLAFKFLS